MFKCNALLQHKALNLISLPSLVIVCIILYTFTLRRRSILLLHGIKQKVKYFLFVIKNQMLSTIFIIDICFYTDTDTLNQIKSMLLKAKFINV
jgi:hypothetical protein